MSDLSELLEDVPVVLVKELATLVRIILLSDSPGEAISKAQKAVLADASDEAADAVLRGLLKHKSTEPL